ncbi:MAG TPA: HEAT repeat domain-containing protein, partial [Nocardioides sp.]
MKLVLWVVVGLLLAAVAFVLLLLILRVGGGIREARRAREHAVSRQSVLTLILGEPEEIDRARAELVAMRGGVWRRAEQQMFSLLPKVSGDARERLVEIVREAGAADQARRMLNARSLVVRCRGAHRLGALGEAADVPALAARLDDRSFLVRRVTLRALGNIGSPAAVPAILASAQDPQLTRDVVSALQRIGMDAAHELRDRLAECLAGQDDHTERIAELIAVSLGLIGDTAAVPILSRALETTSDPVRAEAATALGRIGAPSAVDPLIEALDTDHDRVRRHVAQALGEIGDPRAATALGVALLKSPRPAGRVLAAALLRLGVAGREVLTAHSSPYAREALVVADL